jgi:hypothetical protein
MEDLLPHHKVYQEHQLQLILEVEVVELVLQLDQLFQAETAAKV